MPPTMHGLRSHLGQSGPLAVFGWRSQSSTGVEHCRWWALQCVPGARADSHGQLVAAQVRFAMPQVLRRSSRGEHFRGAGI
jgi:hypothetical protein